MAACQDNGTHCRDQEQEGCGLERNQEALQQQPADLRRGAEAELYGGPVGPD